MNLIFRKIKTAIRLLKRKLTPVPADEQVSFDVRTINEGHVAVTYRGVSMIRCPFDYVLYQMLINEVKPDLIIEVGTNIGGTTLYLADLLDLIGHGAIHSIDIVSRADQLTKNHPRIKLFTDGWQKYDLSEAKKLAANGQKILVIEDASHTYEDSLEALQIFSPLVSVDSYYVVEDGIVNKLGREEGFHGGPLRAIREFLATNPHFIVDRKYCDLFGKNATFNVNGYLKRIR